MLVSAKQKQRAIQEAMTRARRPRPVPKNIKKYVKRTIKEKAPIRSFTREPSAGGEVTTTAQLDDLTEISQSGGTDPEAYRNNQQIVPYKLHLSGVWAAKNTSEIDNYLRLIIFTWKEERGANAPSASEVFGDAYTYPYLSPAFFDIDTTKGKVLYDRLFRIGPQEATVSSTVTRATDSHNSLPIRKTIYLNKHPKITYHSTAGTAGNNHIYALWVGNTTTGTNSSTLQLDTQLHYS